MEKQGKRTGGICFYRLKNQVICSVYSGGVQWHQVAREAWGEI